MIHRDRQSQAAVFRLVNEAGQVLASEVVLRLEWRYVESPGAPRILVERRKLFVCDQLGLDDDAHGAV